MPFPFVTRARYEELAKELAELRVHLKTTSDSVTRVELERSEAQARNDRLVVQLDKAMEQRQGAINRCSELVKLRDSLSDRLLTETTKREQIEAKLAAVTAERDSLQSQFTAAEEEEKNKSESGPTPLRGRPDMSTVKGWAEKAARNGKLPEGIRPVTI